MKFPLERLRTLKLRNKTGGAAKERRDVFSLAQLNYDLAQATLDMENMRDCYDNLLTVAEITANSAYEFSQSLQQMGSCLEKIALLDDEESGRFFSMLGKVQFELQKLVDGYRANVVTTISKPSNYLLSELKMVENMKRQCDVKREVYEHMMAQHKPKRRSKIGKGEVSTSQELETVRNELGEEATLCVFRSKSLKRFQSQSLLTQAARHHSAQLNLFRNGLKSLDAIESRVRMVAEQHRINYQVSGGEDIGGEYVDDGESIGDEESNDGRELSFELDYRESSSRYDVVLDLRNSREPRVGSSHSAPILQERKSELQERIQQMQQSLPAKFNTYVLPTPTDVNGTSTSRPSGLITNTRPSELNINKCTCNLWHSSPLEHMNHYNDHGHSHSSTVDSKTSGGQYFSGPITSKPLPSPILVSPPKIFSPRFSELYELPRPPGNLLTTTSSVDHSATLVRDPKISAVKKVPLSRNLPSPLPRPVLPVSRSLSMPLSKQRPVTVQATYKRGDFGALPSLTPTSMAHFMPASSIPVQISSS